MGVRGEEGQDKSDKKQKGKGKGGKGKGKGSKGKGEGLSQDSPSNKVSGKGKVVFVL